MMINQTTLPFLIIGAALVLFCLIYIRAFITRIAGVWYEQKEPGGPVQEIRLRQFGPWVWGEANVQGGLSLFRGWFNGKTVTLRRKDHGPAYFKHLGFPDAVIGTLDGTEMARAQFNYDSTNNKLVGQHYPQKIEISRTRPPKVLHRHYITPTPRTWVRHPKQLPQPPSRAEA